MEDIDTKLDEVTGAITQAQALKWQPAKQSQISIPPMIHVNIGD